MNAKGGSLVGTDGSMMGVAKETEVKGSLVGPESSCPAEATAVPTPEVDAFPVEAMGGFLVEADQCSLVGAVGSLDE